MKKLLAVFLSALLLAGCTDQPPVATTEPTTVPVTTSPVATDLYAEAVSAIDESGFVIILGQVDRIAEIVPLIGIPLMFGVHHCTSVKHFYLVLTVKPERLPTVLVHTFTYDTIKNIVLQ